MSYLQSISRLSGVDNLGGILTIIVMRADEVESMGDPVDGSVYGDIVMKAGKSPVTWAVTTESARSQSASRTSREGPTKSNKLPFVIPKDRPELQSMLAKAEDDNFIVQYCDSNGKQKVFGTLDAPVRFSYDHDTGASFSNLNSYDCRFYFDGPDNLYHYNGAIPTPTPGSAPAIVRVNGVVVASLAPGESINFDTDFDFDFAIIGT